MPKFFVVHGSVSGKKVGQSLELSQAEADHINSSGKMLRREDEPEEPRKGARTGLRVGLDGKEKVAKLDGNVVSTEADEEGVSVPAEPTRKVLKRKGG